MTKRIGIYPGTFDPVHPGHLAFAREALTTCGLDEIVFLPEQSPRNKRGVSSLAQRVAWLQAATSRHKNFRIAQLSSAQFTVARTLPELRSLLGKSELTLLIGSDVAKGLPQWPGIEELLHEFSLAIGLRDSDAPADFSGLLTDLEEKLETKPRAQFIETDYPHHSSSMLKI